MNTEKTPKLTAGENDERKDIRAMVRENGGDVFTFPDSGNGISVVVEPSVPGMAETSEFVKFSVAQCAPHDKFRRKVGEFKALQAWDMGRTVSLKRQESYGFGGALFTNEEMAQVIANFFE